VIYARSVSLRSVGRMIVGPAGVAAVVGVLVRPLGPTAILLAAAAFLAAQLVVLAQSRRQLEAARRRLEASRAWRNQLRRRRRA
jgi:hypothetical protein